MVAIRRVVCARFGTSDIELLASRRDRYVVDARHAAMWLARRASYSFPEIGRGFKRDHSSVMYAVRRIDGFMREDAGNAALMAELVRALDVMSVTIWPARSAP